MAPYNLRSQAVRTIPIHDRKIDNISRSKKKKAITVAKTGLSFDDIEGAGSMCLGISDEAISRFVDAKIAASGVVYTPPPPPNEEEEARDREQQILDLAKQGVSYLNKKNLKYELVRPVDGAFFLSNRGGVYHANFEAKLKDDPEAETQLFFAEFVAKDPSQLKVTRCCRLGPSGSKAAATGLNDCKVCFEIHHPKNVRFITR